MALIHSLFPIFTVAMGIGAWTIILWKRRDPPDGPEGDF